MSVEMISFCIFLLHSLLFGFWTADSADFLDSTDGGWILVGTICRLVTPCCCLSFPEFVFFLALVDIYCTFGNISYSCTLFTAVYKVFLAVFWNELRILSLKMAVWVCSSVFLFLSFSLCFRCFGIYVHNYKTTTQPRSTEKVRIFLGYLWEQLFGVRSLETALFFDYS